MTGSTNSEKAGNGLPPVNQHFLIVGIGASAGGINALKHFFENVTVDSGMAYVVILHLSPDYESKLAEVLQLTTKLPVCKVDVKTKIEVNNVYVISPDKSLTMNDGHILASPIHTVEERRAPVDIFFRTLAESHGEYSVAVILSGTGANGSMGLKRIKENGGAAFVQLPTQAEFNEMPLHAIATELVDSVLPVEEIPSRIFAYKQRFDSIDHLPFETLVKPEDQQHALRDIFTQIRVRTGHDFSNYKRATVLRRIQRRMSVHSIGDIGMYADFIRDKPDESQALLKDLLISVTNFFRDKEAFDYLQSEVIPTLLEGKTSVDKIRVWITGCATGEEAYSIAMLFAEKTFAIADAPLVQIFATDIDEHALSIAREGLYSLNDCADVSPERLRRFFNVKEGGFRIIREIREMILFANHNLIKDPPFSRLDMATCRNLLIYLNQSAQTRVLEAIHFALNPGGILFIGSSESVDGVGDLYVSMSKEHHIFQSRPMLARKIPVSESSPVHRFEIPQPPDVKTMHEKRILERISYNELHQQLLEYYAPPSVVINQDFDIVHLSERAGKYLIISGGEPSNNILKLIKPELRLELRSGLYQAVERKVNLEIKNLKVQVNENNEVINILIRPVLQHAIINKGYILVIFDKIYEQQPESTDETLIVPDPVAHQLEEELLRSKTQLRSSTEQYEVQAEELKASNEELQAMNEELRSTAEELETSKEELQSINEELITVNQELKIKIEELSQSNNNFQNLIFSTNIGTIFLNRNLRINLFTPSARQIFNLIPNDAGRLLSDISNRLVDTDVLKDVEFVLEKLQTTEREVSTYDNNVFMMRVMPYRTTDDHIKGVVMTFINITERKKAEMELRRSEENLRLLMDSISEYAIITFNTDLKINGWNNGAVIMFGYEPEEIMGKSADILFTEDDKKEGTLFSEVSRVIDKGSVEDERWHVRKNGTHFFASGIVTKMKEGGQDFIKIARDTTTSKLIEQQKDEFISVASHELKSPVTSIKAYAEVLHEMLSETDQSGTQEMMVKLNSQVDRLSNLVTDLLDTTKISEGQLLLKRKEFDLVQLLEEFSEIFQRIAPEHRIILKTGKISPFNGDRERIMQVFTNLFSNAVKYSPKGGEVIISAHDIKNEVVISVEDFGIGMSDNTKALLFQRFYRSENPLINTFPGLGLGLYIVNEIIKSHGGKIKVESVEGKGTKLIITLPRL